MSDEKSFQYARNFAALSFCTKIFSFLFLRSDVCAFISTASFSVMKMFVMSILFEISVKFFVQGYIISPCLDEFGLVKSEA